jgi:hypothetical protein
LWLGTKCLAAGANVRSMIDSACGFVIAPNSYIGDVT